MFEFNCLFAAGTPAAAKVMKNSLISSIAQKCSTTGEQLVAFGIYTAVSIVIAFIVVTVLRYSLRKTSFVSRLSAESNRQVPVQYALFWCIVLTGMYIGTAVFHFPDNISLIVHKTYLALMILLILFGMLRFVSFLNCVFLELAEKKDNVYNKLLINLLTPTCKTVIWTIGILFILDNVFKFNIGSLLAGAGVAAMAVAFAAQNTIANIFGAITLIVDRPFQIGQRIQVDGKTGCVESIGLRSTRIRALDGTLWCIPNKVMSDSSIVNVTIRSYFKHSFVVGLTYSQTPEQMRRGKKILHEILDNHPLIDMTTKPPLITFSNMGAYSLDIQAICWFQTRDFKVFEEAKDEIHFRILEEFAKAGLEIAFPSQSIYIEKTGRNG